MDCQSKRADTAFSPRVSRDGEAPLLTSNDLALALASVQINIAWWKKQPSCGYKTARLRQLDALNKKLSAACDHLNPYSDSDEMPFDWGGDPIYGPLAAEARPRDEQKEAGAAVDTPDMTGGK